MKGNRSINADDIYRLIAFSRGDKYEVESFNEENVDASVLNFFEELIKDIIKNETFGGNRSMILRHSSKLLSRDNPFKDLRTCHYYEKHEKDFRSNPQLQVNHVIKGGSFMTIKKIKRWTSCPDWRSGYMSEA